MSRQEVFFKGSAQYRWENIPVSKRISLHAYEPTELKVDNSNGSRHLQRERENEKTKITKIICRTKSLLYRRRSKEHFTITITKRTKKRSDQKLTYH